MSAKEIISQLDRSLGRENKNKRKRKHSTERSKVATQQSVNKSYLNLANVISANKYGISKT